MKKTVILMLCLLMVIFIPINAQAASRAASVSPELAYTGETALCQVQVTAPGKAIYVQMELWYGSTRVCSWTKSGSSIVSINETCGVHSGLTYTLKVSGTVAGESFICDPVARKCP